MKMKFCSECAAPIVRLIPDGDDHLRDVCSQCKTIFYQNPKVIVGTLPIWDDKVMLCKRAIEPRYGYWTLPAGFLELSESTWQGAQRETREEAGATVEEGMLYGVYDLPYISQIYMFYLAEVKDGLHEAGVESLEVDWFERSQIPWHDLAFPVIKTMLERYFLDRDNGTFSTFHETIEFRPRVHYNNESGD